MNKCKIILVGLLMVAGIARAQNPNNVGYFISNTGDTTHVNFLVPVTDDERIDVAQLQWKIKYLDQYGRKKPVVPQTTREVFISFRKDSVRLYCKRNTIGANAGFLTNADYFFLEQLEGGNVNAYRYYEQSLNGAYMGGSMGMGMGGGMMIGGGTVITPLVALEKPGQALFTPRLLYSKKDMAAYFANCPQVLERIEKGEYKSGNLEVAARDNNILCP